MQIVSTCYAPSLQRIYIQFHHPTNQTLLTASIPLQTTITTYFPDIDINQCTVKDGWEICALIKTCDLELLDHNSGKIDFKLTKREEAR